MGDRRRRATVLAQLGHYVEAGTGAVVPPWQPATTFARDADYALPGGYIYGRSDSPSYAVPEQLLAELDGGADALLFASGLAAAAAILDTVETGQRIVAPRVMYHGLQTWLRRFSAKRGVGVDFVDVTDPAAVRAAMGPRTAILWVETLLNPSWEVVDLAAMADIARAAGAALAVDATVTPPTLLRPIEFGADYVFHAVTKYINGHSDVTAGVVVTARQDERWAEIETIRTLTGGILGPFEAWLTARGMRTLALRVERASANAQALAVAFAGHPGVERVLYPGLPDHPGHVIAARQMPDGFGGMLSLLVRGGAAAARRVATGTAVFLPATSLGGVESLIEHRIAVEPPESEVPPELLRLSVGVEAVEDLIEDLARALDGATG